MANSSFLQNSFLGGEWGKFSQARIDLPQHKSALAKCLNYIPVEEGVLVRRPGFMRAGRAAYNQPNKLQTLSFDGKIPLVAEFGQNMVRFRFGFRWSNYGAHVSTFTQDANGFAILNVSGSFPVPYNVICIPQNAYTKQKTAFVDRKVFFLQLITTGQYYMYDEVTGAQLTYAALRWDSSMAMQVASVVELGTYYGLNDLAQLRFVLAEQQLLVLHPKYPPWMLNLTLGGTSIPFNQYNPSASNIAFTFNKVAFVDGPYLDPSSTQDCQIVSIGTPGTNINYTIAFTSVQNVNNGAGFSARDLGRSIRLFAEPQPYNGATGYTNGQSVKWNNAYYICTGNFLSTSVYSQIIAGQTITGLQPDTNPISWAISTSVQSWAWGYIIQVSGNATIGVSLWGPGTVITPVANVIGNPMIFALGAYSAGQGWPTCGCFAQGRWWLAGAIPNRFDGSVSNNQFLEVFGTGPGSGGPTSQIGFAPTDNNLTLTQPYTLPGFVLDNCGINETLNDAESSEIYWMKPNPNGIIIGTSGGEFLLSGPGNNVITPTNISVLKLTQYKVANIEPRQTGLTTVFVQLYQRRLMEFVTDVFSGKFFAPNLAENTRHLTTPGIAEIWCQEEKTPITWMRLNNGSLLGTTYRRVSMFATEPPKFNGWHQHQHGAGSQIISMTTGPLYDGSTEALTAITLDPATNNYSLEIMMPIPEENDPLTSAWYLDCAQPPVAGATSATDGASGGLTLYGLDYYTGRSVTIFACGLNVGNFAPDATGKVFVPWGSDPDGLFTLAYITALSNTSVYGDRGVPIDNATLIVPIVVGFPYTSQVQLIRRLEPAQGENGPGLGKTRRLHMAAVWLQGAVSGSMKIGTDFLANLKAMLFRSPGNTPYVGNQLFNDVQSPITVTADYNFDNGITLQCTGPYPGNIIAAEGFIQSQDR